MREKITIGLICGGQGLEHEIDLLSARDIASSFDPGKYEVVILGIDKNGTWYFSREPDLVVFPDDLKKIGINKAKPIVIPLPGGRLIDRETQACLAEIDVFFPIADDPIQGFLQTLDVPYIGPDVYGYALGRDKEVCKRLLRESGMPVIPYVTLRANQSISFEEASEQLGLPLFVKACRLGSSIGVYRVSDKTGFYQALKGAFSYDRKVLLEQAVVGREIECAVLGNETPRAAPVLGEITNLKEWFTFEEKYSLKKRGELKIPAEIDESVAQEIRETAVSAFRLLDCEGLARFDFFLKPDDSFLISEINTSPGLGRKFMYPRLWMVSGVPYHELIDQLIQFAMDRHEQEMALNGTLNNLLL